MSTDSHEGRHVYSVVPHGTTWDVHEEGRSEPVASELDRDEAIAMARSMAEGSSFGQIIVHAPDGAIEYESTCAKRPFPRRSTATI